MMKANDIKLMAPCGEHCALCPHYKGERTPRCAGCGYNRGHPFWGECKLYACATKHNIEYCGLYTDFPCDFFVGHLTQKTLKDKETLWCELDF